MLYEFDQQQIATSIPSEVTDEQIMARIQGGDEAALAAMYHRHTPILRTVISRVVHNESDVDRPDPGSIPGTVEPRAKLRRNERQGPRWLVTLARRRAIDKVRRRQAYARAEERLRLETEHEPQLARFHGVEDNVNAADRSEVFKRLLSALPEAQREALHLAYYRGLSQREIAAQTGIPLGTIKTRLELAVRKVRAAILSLGGAEEWAPSHN